MCSNSTRCSDMSRSPSVADINPEDEAADTANWQLGTDSSSMHVSRASPSLVFISAVLPLSHVKSLSVSNT